MYMNAHCPFTVSLYTSASKCAVVGVCIFCCTCLHLFPPLFSWTHHRPLHSVVLTSFPSSLLLHTLSHILCLLLKAANMILVASKVKKYMCVCVQGKRVWEYGEYCVYWSPESFVRVWGCRSIYLLLCFFPTCTCTCRAQYGATFVRPLCFCRSDIHTCTSSHSVQHCVNIFLVLPLPHVHTEFYFTC